MTKSGTTLAMTFSAAISIFDFREGLSTNDTVLAEAMAILEELDEPFCPLRTFLSISLDFSEK